MTFRIGDLIQPSGGYQKSTITVGTWSIDGQWSRINDSYSLSDTFMILRLICPDDPGGSWLMAPDAVAIEVLCPDGHIGILGHGPLEEWPEYWRVL